MSDRMFGPYGPAAIPRQPSSRIVPRPEEGNPFDVNSSIERIRAARERALADQQEVAATESANMQMRDDSEYHHDTKDAGRLWVDAQRDINGDLNPGDAAYQPHGRYTHRDPGALTQEQQAEELQERTAARFQNQAAAQRTTADREDAASQKVTDNRKFEDMWTGMGVDQQVDDMWNGMAAEGNAQMQSQDIIPDNKAVEAKESKRADGIRDMAENEMVASEARIHTPVVSEASPSDAPLPGEETLPPSVARWNQERAMRGGAGMKSLQESYLAEVPEGTRGMMTFDKWLNSKGIGEEVPYAVARGRLNKVTPMGGDVLERKRNQWVETMLKRHGAQMAQNGMTREDLIKAYDSGVSKGATDNNGNPLNDPALAGARGGNRDVINRMKDARTQQIAVNWDKRKEQMGRATSFGMPIATIQFFDSMQAAKTPQELANTLMLAHSSQPRMGWDKAAALLMKGDMDMQALQQWAGQNGGKKNAVDQVGEDLDQIYAGPVGPQTLAQVDMVAQQSLPPNATADQAKEHVATRRQPIARKIVQSANPTGHEILALQQITAGMDAKRFYAYCGLDPNDPKSAAIYQRVFGKPPSRGMINDGLNWLSNAAGFGPAQNGAVAGENGKPRRPF